MFQVFQSCRHFIRTFPALVYDDRDVEDINTDRGGSHLRHGALCADGESISRARPRRRKKARGRPARPAARAEPVPVFYPLADVGRGHGASFASSGPVGDKAVSLDAVGCLQRGRPARRAGFRRLWPGGVMGAVSPMLSAACGAEVPPAKRVSPAWARWSVGSCVLDAVGRLQRGSPLTSVKRAPCGGRTAARPPRTGWQEKSE